MPRRDEGNTSSRRFELSEVAGVVPINTIEKMRDRNTFFKRFMLLFLLFAFAEMGTAATKTTLNRVEPPNWWAGFSNPNLQLLVHGTNIASTDVKLSYPGVTLKTVTKLENPNYLVLDLLLAPDVKPGNFDILFQKKEKTVQRYAYALLEREEGSADREGFNTSDVMYLIMPDRFANGNPDNDYIDGMLEKPDRENLLGRHGGDIEGIRKNLNYVADQGYTAIWLNPVLENDMPQSSYHGYAATDFYRIDRRFGTNEEYRQFSKEAKSKGIKLIMDMIFNHCGALHYWMKDMPSSDWINNVPRGGLDNIEFTDSAMAKMDQSRFVITNHRKSTAQDPYVSEVDQDQMVNGWFVPSMPDLNQKNPYLATYLIQNSIWWVEYVGLAGIRMDTYPYPDQEMMADWTCRLRDEYPDLNIVGEEFNHDANYVAYWQAGKENPNGYTSCLRSVMDFPMQTALTTSLKEKEGWNEGLNRLYSMLAKDFVYADPNNLVIFPDNHDMTRYYSQLDEDFDLFKMGLAYILTMRGIPQIYYATEILSSGLEWESHGYLRKDFPGGWAGDKINAFTGEGLTAQQKEAQAYLKRLLTWRKTSDVIHHGGLKHFLPQNGTYVYFRFNEKGTVMVILNKNEEATLLNTARFDEVMHGMSSGKEIITGKTLHQVSNINVPARSAMIIELN